MKFLFLIQGEGNGHLTQAISLYQMLTAEGHEVVASMIGSRNGKKKPDFFTQAVDGPVYSFRSPGLSFTKKGKLSVIATLSDLVTAIPHLTRSLKQIDDVVAATTPDLIVNFYETSGALYKLFFPNEIPVACIAHQYLFFHPDFPFPSGRRIHRLGLTILNKITAYKASKIYALSFSDKYPSTERIQVVPPLLRKEISALTPSNENHLLVYLTQPRLTVQIEKWHRRNPYHIVHCFSNNPLQKTVQRVGDRLFLHPNNSHTFLKLLETCRAFATTSGFESVCEAMVLGKPVLVVPVPNHYEQECNARDAVYNRVGIADTTFNIDRLLSHAASHQSRSDEASTWLNQKNELILHSLVSLNAPTVKESI